MRLSFKDWFDKVNVEELVEECRVTYLEQHEREPTTEEVDESIEYEYQSQLSDYEDYQYEQYKERDI